MSKPFIDISAKRFREAEAYAAEHKVDLLTAFIDLDVLDTIIRENKANNESRPL